MKNISKLSDKEVVEITRSQDKEMYAEVINRYQEKLIRYASFLIGDEQQGRDVVQEGLVKAYINLNSFDTKRSFSSWIYRIVHNEAMNAVSKSRKQIRLDEKVDFDSGINVEDDLIRDELKKDTHRCLEEMPLIYREPLSLMYLEEKSYEEISDILRIPLGTVGTRISRAKAIMKKLCQKQ